MSAQNSTPTADIDRLRGNTYSKGEYLPFLEGVELFEKSNWNSDTQTMSTPADLVPHEFSAHKMLNRLEYLPPQRDYFKVLQKWEGYVLEIDNEVFRARLIPISGQEDIQEAEIYLSEVTEEDRDLLEPGAVFYWSIGYLVRPSGTLRASLIRFRRLPAWSEDQLYKAERDAHRWGDLFSAE